MIYPQPTAESGRGCASGEAIFRPSVFAFDPAAIHQRIEEVCGHLSAGEVAWLTGAQRSAALREYLSGASPSVEFVCRVCTAFGVSADWLLFGEAPMPPKQQIRLCLQQATASELLREVGRRVHASGKLSPEDNPAPHPSHMCARPD